MAEYREHQIRGGKWALDTIREYGLAYLSWQERCGKSGAAIYCTEASKAKRILIVTKKKAIPGWNETLVMFQTTKIYVVVNYESIHKIKDEFDFIILDEAHHAISSTGRPSATWKKVFGHTRGKAILYLSATPYAEHLGLIYHQLKLSTWTPFKGYRNFYDWFRMYGISHMTRTPYGLVETYTKYKDELILKSIDHLFDFKTRKEVGIKHEPEANVVVVPLRKDTVKLMEEWIKDNMMEIGEHQIIGDTPMAMRSKHYMIEQGVINVSK